MLGPRFGIQIWTQKWGQPSENFAAARSAFSLSASHFVSCTVSPLGQTAVSASLLSTVCDRTCSGENTGLAIHKVVNEFACFPGTTKVAAIASPPEMLRLATGERRVILLHCLEDRLCVWRPDSLTDLSYNIVLIEGHPAWSGRARHA